MKVLLSNFTELKHVGGVNEVVKTLAKGLSRAGCKIVVTEMGEKWGKRLDSEIEIDVWTIATPSELKLSRPRSWFSNIRSALQYLLVLILFRPNVVNVHYPTLQLPPILLATKVFPKRILIPTLHGSDLRNAQTKSPYIRNNQLVFFEKSFVVSVVGPGLVSDAIDIYPTISHKIRILCNGVSSEWFETFSEEINKYDNYFVFVGKLTVLKGIDLLLQAWSKIEKRYPDYQLILVGEGPDEDFFKELIRRYALSQVVLLGYRDSVELKKLYANSSAMVLPSRSEGLPMTLIEAGACGAVRIASNIEGNTALIEHGKTGFIFASESAGGLANSLEEVINMSENQRNLIKRETYRQTIENFSQEAMVNRYLECFREAI